MLLGFAFFRVTTCPSICLLLPTANVFNFPKGHRVKLFRPVVSSDRTGYIVVTNEADQDSTEGTREVCAVRWKIEQFHRESNR